MWSGDHHYSDPTFITISCSCPIRSFLDSSKVEWSFRELGPNKKTEAIIILPGIRETVSSYFHMMPALAARGYRVLTIGYPDYQSYIPYHKGFCELMYHLKIMEIHFIGNDFGGFVSLQLNSAPKKTYLPKSITLINSYTNIDHYAPTGINSIRLFRAVTAKSVLIEELVNNHLLEHPTQSIMFIGHEIEAITNKSAVCRVELRKKKGYPIDILIPDEAVMIVESNDRAINYPEDSLPSKKFPKAKYALMKEGGDYPHLEAPNDLLPYIMSHLRQFSSEQIDVESEE